jgi:ADP-ribose pyrophosphatase YjhB (NUDIX family)
MALQEPLWLRVAREMGAIAQTGLTFSQDPYDRLRYERLRELSAEMLAQGSAADYERILESLRSESGYATPKVDVRGAAFRDGRVLLVREINDGKWTLPGGWADVNQTAAQCVVREIAEESGFEARAVKLAAIHDYQTRNRPHHKDSIYKLMFICEIIGGEARPSNETSEVGFFPCHDLPPLSVGRSTAAQIGLMFRHRDDPALPTEFD